MLQPFTQCYINKAAIRHSAAVFGKILLALNIESGLHKTYEFPLRFSRIKKILFRSHFSMSTFRTAMTQHYLLKLLNQVAYTEWACLVVYTLHALAGFCFRFWVTNSMCTVKELHHLPADRTIASYPALWTFTPTIPSYFQWICFGFFTQQVQRWSLASSCLPEYPSVCPHGTE